MRLVRNFPKQIQEVIDDFSKRDVSNLHIWVPELNSQLEVIFSKRLEVLVQEWVKEFISYSNSDDLDDKQFTYVQEEMRL